MQFPRDFLWGAATSSYQIEGAAQEDGRGPSIWDTFCATPGKVYGDHSGAIACDHYHRYAEDIALMQSLGLHAYRFSVAWPRIFPQGRGKPNPLGLGFYDRLVDGLLAANIQPLLTLYHWDLPQALQDQGGWANRDTLKAFADYADVMARRLGDRVKLWATLNEPWCISILSHALGKHAPGKTDWKLALQVAHHLFIAHGLALDALRASASAVQAGIVLNFTWVSPATDKQEDEEAAQRYDGFFNRWFLDPLFKGRYPEDMWEVYAPNVPDIQADDMAFIQRPMDFLGVNYYTRDLVGRGQDALGLRFERNPKAEYTTMNWEVYPQGLEDMLVRLHADYSIPQLYVTENGAAFDDVLTPDGVHDARRRAYLEAHFQAAYNALQRGVPLRGYFVWSLLDNFEWAEGYTKRFGIVYVDYKTQKRTLKDSALWYRDFIAQQRA